MENYPPEKHLQACAVGRNPAQQQSWVPLAEENRNQIKILNGKTLLEIGITHLTIYG